jgi:capsular polysaccharide biosynthesis protein
MIKTFTHDDVIRLAYQETNEEETSEIQTALLCDPDLMDFYKRIVRSKSMLDEVEKEPSEYSVNNILNYARAMNWHTVSN